MGGGGGTLNSHDDDDDDDDDDGGGNGGETNANNFTALLNSYPSTYWQLLMLPTTHPTRDSWRLGFSVKTMNNINSYKLNSP